MRDNHDYERERRMIGRLETLDHMLHTLRNAIRTRASEDSIARQVLAITANLCWLQLPWPEEWQATGHPISRALNEISDVTRGALLDDTL